MTRGNWQRGQLRVCQYSFGYLAARCRFLDLLRTGKVRQVQLRLPLAVVRLGDCRVSSRDHFRNPQQRSLCKVSLQLVGLASERRATAQHFVGQNAHRPPLRSRAVVLALDNFGRHVPAKRHEATMISSLNTTTTNSNGSNRAAVAGLAKQHALRSADEAISLGSAAHRNLRAAPPCPCAWRLWAARHLHVVHYARQVEV